MRFINLKLNKVIFVGIVMIIGFILLLGIYFRVGNDEYSLMDSDNEKDGVDFIEQKEDSNEGDESKTIDIFPEEDYEDWDIEDTREFFVEYRLQRDKIRSKEIDKLNQLMDNPEISQEAKEKAENKLIEVLEVMEKEMLIENLIKAHGYKDAILFYKDDAATVVIKEEDLNEDEIRQIMELVSDKSDTSLEQVKVIENI